MSSLILQTVTRAVFQTILVLAVFLLFAGHNAPGGGFVGGLMAAGAFALRYVSEGFDDLHRLIPVSPYTLLGTGLLLSTGIGVAALVAGGAFLESAFVELELPLLGRVAASSVIVFDIGVFLIVVGLALALLDTLGGELGGTQE